MADRRQQLPPGTQLRMESGNLYTITGEAMGFGGGSLIYPARRLIMQDGKPVSDGFEYVVKECFPAAAHFRFVREPDGEILPETDSEEARQYLCRARQMQLEEGDVSRNIYRTASRMLPIRESSSTVTLTLPGREPLQAANTITIMESLSEKGRSLTAWLRERRQFAPGEAFRILQQLLFSLREVHQAGYLHLDIQDGNIFLRGALTREEGGELVTLLDFGSARALENGKTRPIRDRVIFTSRGFSAPEMLLRNDGTLTLGPEADLYSVGCLALYLLTGQKPDTRMLLGGSGVFLKPNQIRRMKCPRHLTDGIQRFLSRALEKEPENRYHSAEEMLAVVTDLAEALQPYRTDLHNVTYDAFICYKHGPVDSTAALTLQRQLEQYRAPRGTAASRKPFRRVFVDEGELSSCADFGLQIREALKNSGWLIVVCSPDTPLSPWVQLEIDTFLEFHDRSRILAVLTGGDEKVSFPPSLQADATGNGEILAADARGADLREVEKKLRGDALLKLIAPMLGTTFDTLKQRQKIYLLQRAAAVTGLFLALAVAFAAYALNRASVIADQARQIEEEYRNSLLNESRFLAEQAEKRLADKDPLGALELALAAMPSPEQDRPLLPQLEYTLGKALSIYSTPLSAGNTLTAVGILDAGDPDFLVNDSGSLIFTWENYTDGRIRIWDARTLSQTGELSTGATVSLEPVFADDTELVLDCYDRLVSFNHRTGTENWSVPLKNLMAVEISPDREYLYALRSKPSLYDLEKEGAYPTPSLSVISAKTGEILRWVPFTEGENQELIQKFCVSSDRKWAAVCTSATDSGDILTPHHSIYLLNLEQGSCTPLFRSETEVFSMTFAGHQLALLRGTGFTLTTLEGKIPYSIIEPQPLRYELYDAPSATRLWSREGLRYPKTTGLLEIRNVIDANGDPALLYVNDDRCSLLRRSDGTLIRDYVLQDAVMDLQLTQNGFETINADGSRSQVRFARNSVRNYQVLETPVTAVYRRGDAVYLQSAPYFSGNDRIYKFQFGKYDDGYQLLWENPDADWEYFAYRNAPEGARVVLTRDNQVCLVDLASGETFIHGVPRDYDFSKYNCLGLSPEGTALYWTGRYLDDAECWITGREIYRMDLTTGAIRKLAAPRQPENCRPISRLGFNQEQLLFTAEVLEGEEPVWTVFSWDLLSGTLEALCAFRMPEDYAYVDGSFALEPVSGSLCFAIGPWLEYEPRELVRMEADGTFVRLPITFPLETTESYPPWIYNSYQWDPTGRFAVFGYCDRIYVVNREGSLLFSVPLDSNPVALQFSPDGERLYLACRDGILSQYRLPDGARLSRIVLEEHTALSIIPSDAEYFWLGDTTLGIFDGHAGFLVDLSGETMTMKAVIDQCFGYDTAKNRFLTIDSPYAAGAIGSFPRYTMEELREKAIQILNQE